MGVTIYETSACLITYLNTALSSHMLPPLTMSDMHSVLLCFLYSTQTVFNDIILYISCLHINCWYLHLIRQGRDLVSYV